MCCMTTLTRLLEYWHEPPIALCGGIFMCATLSFVTLLAMKSMTRPGRFPGRIQNYGIKIKTSMEKSRLKYLTKYNYSENREATFQDNFSDWSRYRTHQIDIIFPICLLQYITKTPEESAPCYRSNVFPDKQIFVAIKVHISISIHWRLFYR